MTKTPGLTPIITSKQASGATNSEAPQAPKTPSATNELKGAVRNDPGAASDFFHITVDLSESSESSDETGVNPPNGSMSVRVGKGDGADFQWNQRTPRAQSAEPRMLTLSIPSSQDLLAARIRSGSATPRKSVTPHTNKEKVAALGYTATSPFSRMNNAMFDTEFQRNFFLERAQRHGYALAEIEERRPGGQNPSAPMSGREKDDALRKEWHAKETANSKAARLLNSRASQTTAEEDDTETERKLNNERKKATSFFDARAGQTKEEKIAFALNLARIIVHKKSNKFHGVDSHTLDALENERSALESEHSRSQAPSAVNSPQLGAVSPFEDRLEFEALDGGNRFPNHSKTNFAKFNLQRAGFDFRDRSGSVVSTGGSSHLPRDTETIASELHETDARLDAKHPELHPSAIDEGIKFIKDLLTPETKDAAKADEGARRAWTPFKNNSDETTREINEVVNLFVETCDYNNALASKRNEAAEAQHRALSNAVLPRLGMPVLLRGDRQADDIRAKAAEEFSAHMNWGSGSRVKGFFQDIWAVVGTVLGLGFPLISSSWVNFCKSRWSRSYRTSAIERQADLQQTWKLQELNRNKAEAWVKEITRRHNADPDAVSPTGFQEAFEQQSEKYEGLSAYVESLPEDASAAQIFEKIEQYGYPGLHRKLKTERDNSVKANFLEEIRTQGRVNITGRQRRRLAGRITALPENATKAQILAVVEEHGPRALHEDLKQRPGLSPKDRILMELENLGRQELVDEVAAQLEFAQEAEILAEKERQAAAYGCSVNNPRVSVPDEDYLLEWKFLRTMAEGIVQGIENALPPVEDRIPALNMGLYPIASDGAAEADEDRPDG